MDPDPVAVENYLSNLKIELMKPPCTYPSDFAELVLGLLGGDPVDDEPALHVVDDAKVLAGLLYLDDVHESGGEPGVGPHLAVNLDKTLLHNGVDLLHGQGVLQPVPGERERYFFPATV